MVDKAVSWKCISESQVDQRVPVRMRPSNEDDCLVWQKRWLHMERLLMTLSNSKLLIDVEKQSVS